jgi:glucose-1-phosphate thymidylyltransferase
MEFRYAEQPRPEGLAQALLIGREFLAGGPAGLILGDNLFYGHQLPDLLRRGAALHSGALIFAYRVRNPERYGVIELDSSGRPLSLEEKPALPRSRLAVPGLYFYGPEVCELAATLKPSARGELEISDLNRLFLEQGRLTVQKLGRGAAWLDTGAARSLLEASQFIAVLEERQGLKVACLEEIAWRNGWIGLAELQAEAEAMGASPYAQYLRELAEEGAP